MARRDRALWTSALMLALAAVVGCRSAVLGQEAPPPATVPAAEPAAGELYKSGPGRWAVKIIDEPWKDEARNRTIPVRIYLPQDAGEKGGDEKRPVVVFSHGLGGSGQNYVYFGTHLASHGYIVVAPTHPGSDTAQAKEWIRTHGGLLGKPASEPGKQTDNAEKPTEPERPIERVRERIKERREDETAQKPAQKGPEPGAGMFPGMTGEGGWLMTTINDPANLRNRPKDISFVLDRVAAHEILGPIADMNRVGVAGHSFGAYTAMAIGGMTVDLPESYGGKGQSFRDPRVKAVLPMSPEGSGTMGIAPGAWAKFDAPALFLTGTRDYGAGARSAAWRREAFEGATRVDRALVTIQYAGHMTFANPGEKGLQQAAAGLGVGFLLGAGNAKQQEEHIALVDSLSMLFFDAYVRGDADALKRLQAFCAAKHAGSVAEFFPAARPAP